MERFNFCSVDLYYNVETPCIKTFDSIRYRQTGDICGLLSVLYAVVMMVTGLGVAVAEVYVKKPMPAV